MAFSLGPTGILGHGIMYRGSYASGGNSSHYIPRSVFIHHAGTTTNYTFHIGNDFGMSVGGGYLMLTGHGWQNDRLHGMIEFRNGGGGDGLTDVAFHQIIRNNMNVAVSIPSGETHKIKITFTSIHNNSHGWNFHLYGGH